MYCFEVVLLCSRRDLGSWEVGGAACHPVPQVSRDFLVFLCHPLGVPLPAHRPSAGHPWHMVIWLQALGLPGSWVQLGTLLASNVGNPRPGIVVAVRVAMAARCGLGPYHFCL